MLIGVDVITPLTGPWDQQLALVQRGKFNVGKVQISDGFATAPENVAQLLEVLVPGPNGRKTIIYRSDDKAYDAAALEHDFVGRGFDDFVAQHPDVDHYIEVGNEPDHAGISPEQHAANLRSAITLKGQIGHGRLSWLASLPTVYDQAVAVLDATANYDGLATHWYSWTDPKTDAGGGDWQKILDHLLTLDRAVWVTECGIDDHATPQAVKAQRILDWSMTLPPRVVGVTVFAVGQGTQWPQYELDAAAADVYAARGKGAVMAEQQAAPPEQPAAIHYPTGGRQSVQDVPGYGSNVISGPFLEYYQTNGGVRIFGLALSDVMVEDGRPVQYFERAVMEYHPEADNAAWRVQLRRLGAAVFDAKYRKAG